MLNYISDPSAAQRPMAFRASILNEASPEGLPDGSWEDWCAAVGVENAAMARELLNELSAYYRTSKTKAPPRSVTTTAERLGKDVHVVFVWMMTPDFRGEPAGMPMRSDPNNIDSYYLVELMRKECRNGGGARNIEQLASEAWHDKLLYDEVKARIVQAHGVEYATFEED